MEGQDLVALLPTGFGKGLAFQLPAFMQEGLTVVISPLVALTKDQADRLLELGLPVGAVHSLMGSGEQRSVLDEVRAGRVQLLYVSPERLNRSKALWNLIQGGAFCGETAAGGFRRGPLPGGVGLRLSARLPQGSGKAEGSRRGSPELFHRYPGLEGSQAAAGGR